MLSFIITVINALKPILFPCQSTNHLPHTCFFVIINPMFYLPLNNKNPINLVPQNSHSNSTYIPRQKNFVFEQIATHGYEPLLDYRIRRNITDHLTTNHVGPLPHSCLAFKYFYFSK